MLPEWYNTKSQSNKKTLNITPGHCETRNRVKQSLKNEGVFIYYHSPAVADV